MIEKAVITSLDQVTTEWLTSVLSISGALIKGKVMAFDSVQGRGNWSTSARLKLRYKNGSQGALPERLFLKMVNTDLDDESFNDSEVTYYARDYSDVYGAPLIRCHDAAFSTEQRRYHLLMDDLSETHFEAAQKAPTLGYGLALADGLALMHARWWGAARLAEAGAPIHSPAQIRRFVAIAEPGVGYILERFSEHLEPHWPDVIRELFSQHPRALITRTQVDNGFTLIHGDLGQCNILVPRNGERPVYFIDRQPFDWSLTTWLGVYDLAYAMVIDWEVETRRRLELPVLRRYHAQLIKNGINSYSWEQLFDDYRLCVAMAVYIATEFCRGGVNENHIRYWLPMLQRSLTACDDLDCRALW